VVVAARNEADRLAGTLAALTRVFPGAPMWVADDGSTDATAEIAVELGARVVSSGRPIGKGAAMTAAARTAVQELRVSIGEGSDQWIFVLCDGDLGDSAAALSGLARSVGRGEADVAVAVFATRVGGGLGLARGFAHWAIARRCGLRTRAPLSGQRALGAHMLESVLPFAPGFGMEMGMTIDAVRAGYRLAEVELELNHRASGRTAAGFMHRGRQLVDCLRVYVSRREGRRA
jgi:glycosyltransferase involved in cell wall biosynthesis